MRERIEIWKLVSDQGAFYTLERGGVRRDFMKLGVLGSLKLNENVPVRFKNGFRTIMNFEEAGIC